ncbi:MAG: Gfo/Idh/MocA family oxidoreductase, partial [Boseongicola sp.]|nr:Gfo/Idh/MocA family oxidoreductase [Boseongicola sp.]
MTEIGVGIIGGGYMGKAHAVAYAAVGAVFNTQLRPRLEMVAASSRASAERYAKDFGFRRAAENWESLVRDPAVEAVVIASPQSTHRAAAELAFSLGKPVFCEKPLGASVADAEAMVAAASAAKCVNMVGFNYIRTPASQYARKLISDGTIG